MDLATGRVTSRPRVEKVKMTRLVIDRVKTLAKRQGLKSLKFFNQKHEEMELLDADLVEGVDIVDEDEEFSPLPPINDGLGEDPEGDVDLNVDEDLDPEELADLLSEQRDDEKAQDELVAQNDDDGSEGEDEPVDEPEVCVPEDISDDLDTPSLISEPMVSDDGPRRSSRERSVPERYNPT